MEIKQKDSGKRGKFYIELNGKEEAEMVYTYRGPKKISIDHTEVSEKLKGQGVGYELLEAMVAFMRKNNLKAIPLCPFVNAVFKRRRDEYKDILV